MWANDSNLVFGKTHTVFCLFVLFFNYAFLLNIIGKKQQKIWTGTDVQGTKHLSAGVADACAQGSYGNGKPSDAPFTCTPMRSGKNRSTTSDLIGIYGAILFEMEHLDDVILITSGFESNCCIRNLKTDHHPLDFLYNQFELKLF